MQYVSMFIGVYIFLTAHIEENIKHDTKRVNANILELYETKCVIHWEFISDKHGIIYESRLKNERGAGLILDKCMKKCTLGYCQLSERIIGVKLKGKPFKLPIIVAYSWTAQRTEEIEMFICTIDNAKASKIECQSSVLHCYF